MLSFSIRFKSSICCIFCTIAIVSLGFDIVIGGINGAVGLFVGVMLQVIIPWEKVTGLLLPADAELKGSGRTGVGSIVNCLSSIIGVIGDLRSSWVGLFRWSPGSIP